jgi:hypothetical protein
VDPYSCLEEEIGQLLNKRRPLAPTPLVVVCVKSIGFDWSKLKRLVMIPIGAFTGNISFM